MSLWAASSCCTVSHIQQMNKKNKLGLRLTQRVQTSAKVNSPLSFNMQICKCKHYTQYLWRLFQNDYSNFGFYSDVWGGLCCVVHLVTPRYSFHLQLVCARTANSVHFAISNGVLIDLHWTAFYSAFTPRLFGSIKMDNAAFATFLRVVVKAVGRILVLQECSVWLVCTL